MRTIDEILKERDYEIDFFNDPELVRIISQEYADEVALAILDYAVKKFETVLQPEGFLWYDRKDDLYHSKGLLAKFKKEHNL